MRFYVIGKYDDGLNAVLDAYESADRARRAIVWQGQPMGDLDWHDSPRTRATVVNHGWRGSYSVEWVICEPSNLRGVFLPLDGTAPVFTARGAFTESAYANVVGEAVAEYAAAQKTADTL